MKAKKQIKIVVQFLIVIMLFQSCSVYKPTSMTLEQLTKTDSKILIKTNDARALKFKFNSVEFDNERYYGIKKNTSKRILIFENDIESIKLRDRKASFQKRFWFSH